MTAAWAQIEQFGHRRYFGTWERDDEPLGVPMLRITVPAHTVERGDELHHYDEASVLIAPASVFQLSPASEADCMAELARPWSSTIKLGTPRIEPRHLLTAEPEVVEVKAIPLDPDDPHPDIPF